MLYTNVFYNQVCHNELILYKTLLLKGSSSQKLTFLFALRIGSFPLADTKGPRARFDLNILLLMLINKNL